MKAWLLVLVAGCGSEIDVAFDDTPDPVESKADRLSAAQVEVKVTLAEGDSAKAHQVFKLAHHDPSKREVYFFDTGDLALSRSGLILRARKVKDGPDDTTVKIRPLAAADVAPSWFDEDGFKCEEDWVGAKHVSSCSFTKGPDHDLEDNLDHPKRLFDDDQEDFLADYAGPVDWAGLLVLGPTDARVWKLRASGFAYRLTIEEWSWPDGRHLVELSTRVDAAQATRVQDRLMDFVEGLGFATPTAQETKTQVALQYFTQD